MTETNITAVMLTLNEAENIENTLASAEPVFDELVLVDGDSDDATVAIAREWCDENGKRFDVVESTEREYLLDGPGLQRRRGEKLATCDYTMAIGADVEVEVLDADWFTREFEHLGYIHTRMKPSGRVERDYRLYKPFPDPDEVPFTHDVRSVPRWRGIIHEEIKDQFNTHLSKRYRVVEAPMVHHQQRFGAMDALGKWSHHQRRHDPRVGGNAGRALKKQHFLLQRALASKRQRTYVADAYKDYYTENKALVNKHWREILDEYDLPQISMDHDDVMDQTVVHGWEFDLTEPVMDHRDLTFRTYLSDRVGSYVGAIF